MAEQAPSHHHHHHHQQSTLKQSIRVTRAAAAEAAAADVATVDDDDAVGADAALMREENRMLDEDEEITSDEESEAAEKMERKLMTVALVKSVVETGGTAGGTDGDGTKTLTASVCSPLKKKLHQPPDVVSSYSSSLSTSKDPPTRYGLRKRRRSAGNDLKRLEDNQAANAGGLPRLAIDSGELLSKGGKGVLPSVSSTTSTSMVPNPLAATPIPPPPLLPTKTMTCMSPNATTQPASGVPCPLPAEGSPRPPLPIASSTTPTLLPKVEAGHQPQQTEHLSSLDKRKVTICEESVRTRGLSLDLESVELGFPDEDCTGTNSGELALPTPSGGGGRGRAFSFECFAFGITPDEPLPLLEESNDSTDPVSTASQQQLRPEVLPSAAVAAPVSVADHQPVEDIPGGRPRGESIIFDPSSFQEGGIHEQSALETARAASSDIPGVSLRTASSSSNNNNNIHPGQPKPDDAISASQQLMLPPQAQAPIANITATKPSLHLGFTASSTLPAVTSYTATTTTESSTTTTTVTVAASAATAAAASMAMELLNKDGRIGIYLPEARKARIARFHAKRARRIWRKRIKYDCRKKLADSRPRIKGRFVKRSDMEEE